MHHVEGTGGGGGEGQEFDFDIWIDGNGLSELKPVFEKHGATSPSTMTMTSPAMHSLIAELGKTEPQHIGTVLSAINKITSATLEKIVVSKEEQRVIQSITANLQVLDEEQTAFQKLKKEHHTELTRLMTRLNDDQLPKIENMKTKVNDSFNELTRRMQRRKDIILKEIETINSDPSDVDDDDEKKEMDDESPLITACFRNLTKSMKFIKGQRKIYDDLTSTNDDADKRERAVIDLGQTTTKDFAESQQHINEHIEKIKDEIQRNNDTVIDVEFEFDHKEFDEMMRGIAGVLTLRNEKLRFDADDREFKSGLETFFSTFAPHIMWKKSLSLNDIQLLRKRVEEWNLWDLDTIMQEILSMTMPNDNNADILQQVSSRLATRIWKKVTELHDVTLSRALCCFRRYWKFIGYPVVTDNGITDNELEVMVHNIHDSNPGKYLVFSKATTFDAFRRSICSLFKFSAEQTDKIQMAFFDDFESKTTLICAENFDQMIGFMMMSATADRKFQSQQTQTQTINRNDAQYLPSLIFQMFHTRIARHIYCGLRPESPPSIVSVECKFKGEVTVKLQSNVLNTFNFSVEDSTAHQVEFEPKSSRTFTTTILGLTASKQYRVRVRASNMLGTSDWSEWAPTSPFRIITDDEEKENTANNAGQRSGGIVPSTSSIATAQPLFADQVDQRGQHSHAALSSDRYDPSDCVLAQGGSTRYVFLFADKAPHEATYGLGVFGTNEVQPFIGVDWDHYAYMCVFHDSTAQDIELPLIVNIYSTKPPRKKYSVVEKPDANPKMDMDTKSWTIPSGRREIFVDFRNYDTSKNDHYESILKSILRKLFDLMKRRKLSPKGGFLLIFRTYYRFTGNKRNSPKLLQKHRVVMILVNYLTEQFHKIKKVHSWTDMSIALICLTALWFLTQKTKTIGDKQLADTLHAVYSPDRGPPLIILENLRQIFQENDVHVLQNKLMGKIRVEKQQSTRYGFAAFYNLLHCAYADPKVDHKQRISNMLYPIPHIQHLFGLVIDDLTFVSLNRGIPLERKLMTNLLAAGRRGQEFDLAFKYDFVKQIMDKLSEIEYLFSFLTSCQHEIMNLLGDDTEYWLALVHYVIERCKIPLKTPIIELQLSGFQTQTMTLISSMFCHKVARINRDRDSQSMYKLCEDYPVIMDEKVRRSIMDNEYLLNQFKFVAFIHDLLRAQLAPDTWQQDLSKCIDVWVSYHGLAAAINVLIEYNLELEVFEAYCKSHDVNRYIPGEMEKKFEMMCDPRVPNEVKKIVAQTISAPWNTYDKATRQFLSDGCVYLLKNGAVEAVDTILRNVIGRENPFDGNNDVTIITDLRSDIGKSFVELLSALRRTQHYNQLSIKDRLQGFQQTLNVVRSDIHDMELDANLDMIMNDELPHGVRNVVASKITRSWKQFNDTERNLILNAVSLLLHSDPKTADIVLRNVLEKEELFVSEDIEEIISYLISDVGIQFVHLLLAVRGTPNYSQSWICQQMNSFETKWGLKLKQMADEMDQQTLARVTGFVFLDEQKRGADSNLYLQVQLATTEHNNDTKDELMMENEFDALVDRLSRSEKIPRNNVVQKWDLCKSIAQNRLSYNEINGGAVSFQNDYIPLDIELSELQMMEKNLKIQ